MQPSILSLIENDASPHLSILKADESGCYTCDDPGCECYSAPCDCDSSPCQSE